MMKHLPYCGALLATLLGAFMPNASRADVKEFVDQGKISWTGNPAQSWIDDTQLLLKFTDTTPETCSFKLDDGIKAQVRIVAVGGGGAGGTIHTSGYGGGGGGAGALVDTTLQLNGETGGTTYPITVGAGGEKPDAETTLAIGDDGDPSSFGELVSAIGGGGGGAASVGRDGACGGGGSGSGSTTAKKKEGGSSLIADGFAGGLSKNSGLAGGGGGMGAVGNPSTSGAPGAGGAGKAVDITGDDGLYLAAGGGGGRYSGKTIAAGGNGGGGAGGAGGTSGSGMAEAVDGTPGTGSGGGGSGNYLVGGAGGSGVVYVRVLMATETRIEVPSVADITYDGENHVAFDFGFAYEYVSGTTNATLVGDYAFVVRPAEEFQWKDGGGRGDKTVSWKIVPAKVERPAAKSGLVYNGSEQSGADVILVDYSLTPGSVYKATNAGSYTFTAVLNDKANTCWDDGKTDDLTVAWSIAAVKVARPEAAAELVYNGKSQNAFGALKLDLYTVSGVTNATDAGDYSATFTLKNPVEAANYVWNTDPETATPYVADWGIDRATNAISKLQISGWRLGSTPSKPSCVALWGQETVGYAYSMDRDKGPWETEAALTEAGTWYVRAVVPEAKNWESATNYAEFALWDDPAKVFVNSVRIKIPGVGEKLPIHQALVRLSPTLLHGFEYSSAGSDGKMLAFLDDADNLLPYEVDTWNVDGESCVWVRVLDMPADGTTVTLYWGLRPKQAAPSYDASQVWTNYAGVWHMNEQITASAAATTVSRDSSPNGLDAVPTSTKKPSEMISLAGVIGNGRQNSSSTSAQKGNHLLTPDYSSLKVGGYFTASGWFKMYAASASGRTALLSRRHLYDNNTTDYGWGIEGEQNYTTKIRARGYRSYRVTNMVVPDMKNTWVHLCMVYSGNTFTIFANGKQMTTGTWAGPEDAKVLGEVPYGLGIGNDAAGSGYSLNGAYDEVRLRKGAMSAAAIAGEYAIESGTACNVFDLVLRDGKRVNYWVEEPVISPTTWDITAPEEERGKLVNPGKLAEGTVTNYYYDIYEPTNVFSDISQLVEAGYYRAVFAQKDAEGYEPLVKTVDIRILSPEPYYDVRGTDGDSGRVLLMNNDKLKLDGQSLQVNSQGYADTAQTRSTYWVIPNEEGEEKQGTKSDLKQSGVSKPSSVDCADFNIKVGRSSTLMKKDGSRLWHLEDCRHGNTYVFDPSSTLKETYALRASQNYLPFADTSYDIMVKQMGSKAKRRSAGQIVMRNRLTAAVYSPCYTNGLGTVYFDAVNGWANDTTDGGGYRIAVQWATNALDRFLMPALPLDANCFKVDEETGATNWYARLDGQWHDADMLVYTRDGTDGFSGPVTTSELSLAIRNGGSDRNFYRIAVPLNFDVPARFRIIRRSLADGYAIDDSTYDNGGFALLDNVIVSYPPMWAEAAPISKLDLARHGKQALGYEISTSVPYPVIGEAGARLRARAIPHANDGNPEARPAEFIKGVKAHYRWRYLNQRFGDWYEAYLDPVNGYLSVDPLVIPSAPGDIEYWFECGLQAPFFSYVDYSGTGLGIPYSEEILSITNRLGATEVPSAGTDWYFRLREGRSDRQGVKVVMKGALAGEYELTPIEDHLWRGFVKNPTNVSGKCSFTFVGYNEQTAGAKEYETNSIAWGASTATTVRELPANGTLSVGGEGIEFTVSHAANYYEVRMNEETLTWTIATAEYQDFNEWSDARGARFVGSSALGNQKGTSPTKKTYVETFDDWAAMASTNANWSLFPFDDLNHLQGRTAYVQQPSDTAGSWAVGPGMWVAKYYGDRSANANGAGVAYQLKGCGEGYVQYTQKDDAPRGLESISLNARIGQYINFSDFAFYDGGVKSRMTNYVFTARGSFDRNANADFAGNASLSLVAYYRETKGCYEARWEQFGGTWTKAYSQGGKCSGVSDKGQRLCLYRWNCNASSGKLTATLLGAWTNTSKKVKLSTGKGTSYNASHAQPLMISVENVDKATRVIVGVADAGTASSPNATFGQPYANDQSRRWYGFYCNDTSASRLTGGTYGMLTANCPGLFSASTAFKYTKPVVWDEGVFKSAKGAYEGTGSAGVQFTFAGQPEDSLRGCNPDFADDLWVVTPGRMYYQDKVQDSSGFVFGTSAPQTLKFWTAPAGGGEWTLLKSVDLSGSFGSVTKAETYSVNLYSTADCAVKVTTGGEYDDPRIDVILDSVTVRQFRGNDYSDADEMTEAVGGVKRIPTWTNPTNVRAMTNFVFTSAWIVNGDKRTDGKILLSARRAKSGKISGIRSPLLDGTYGRGKGLGMYSFQYEKAQSNAKLLVQVATNGVSYVDYANYDSLLASNYWQTVATVDFSAMTAAQRESGTLSYYFGIHDKAAGVRLIVDPATVEAVAGYTDTTRFGDVYITKVLVRDEPAVGAGCWTGWNLRMVSSDLAGDTENRMYLPDYADTLEDRGMSAALNNSATADVDPDDDLTYRQNVPFVQTPNFGDGIVGEISFRARTYDQNQSQPANVRIYGSHTGGTSQSDWERIADVEITNDLYGVYTHRVESTKEYVAFRLGVTGASGVYSPGPVKPDGYDAAVRVLLDEVVVSQAIQARVGFRNVGAFKSDIVNTGIVPDVPSRKEQPLSMEAWGVQCELYGAQQPDSIDFAHTPTVVLHWFTGAYPWGYDNWKGEKGAKSAYLRLATDSGVSNWVFRSSQRACPDAVIPMATESPTIVQYTLEVVFYTKEDGDTPMTNWLTRAEWEKPEWYDPLDYNADYPKFAAYNILDNVAPGWAWINEVNLFGSFDYNLNNSEGSRQYVEIAQPPEAELLDWEVRLLEAQSGNDLVLTNVLAVFGRGGFAAKKDAKYVDPSANMTFRTIANRAARENGFVKYDDGTLDAVWKVDNPTTVFSPEGEISAYNPVAFQLVRSSGIVEHEIVVMGTNWWNDLPEAYRVAYHPTNTVNYLNGKLRNADFLYVGKEDDAGDGKSLSVFRDNGSEADDWTNLAGWTPGRLNEGQTIDPDHPVPSGESIIIYASVSGDYIAQRGDDGGFTTQMQMLTVQKGSLKGTNLLYRVDPWYVLGAVTTNYVSALGGAVRRGATQPKYYELTVGRCCSNNVNVVASAAPDPMFAERYGIAEDDAYRPAILSWLRAGEDAYGNGWENVEAGEIHLADFLSLNGTVVTQMTLKAMYWLDMDPTVTNQALIGGVSSKVETHEMTLLEEAVTNLRYDVYMMFTNRTVDVTDTRHYGWHRPPYTLRGLAEGSLSMDFDLAAEQWYGPTFKPTGLMANGLTSARNPDNWVPLRWFVFGEDTFAADGTSKIEVEDPYWHGSAGYNSGWGAYMREHGWQQIYYFWSIDTRIRPITIEKMKTNNYYGE